MRVGDLVRVETTFHIQMNALFLFALARLIVFLATHFAPAIIGLIHVRRRRILQGWNHRVFCRSDKRHKRNESGKQCRDRCGHDSEKNSYVRHNPKFIDIGYYNEWVQVFFPGIVPCLGWTMGRNEGRTKY